VSSPDVTDAEKRSVTYACTLSPPDANASASGTVTSVVASTPLVVSTQTWSERLAFAIA